jgi:hypothetical protein
VVCRLAGLELGLQASPGHRIEVDAFDMPDTAQENVNDAIRAGCGCRRDDPVASR